MKLSCRTLAFALCILPAVFSCTKSETAYAPVEISFYISDPDGLIPDGEETAVIATCTRDGKRGTAMSANGTARYRASVNAGKCTLKPVSGADRITAKYGDTDIAYTVIYPYSESSESGTRVPEKQIYGEPLPSVVTGAASSPTVKSSAVIAVERKPECAVLSCEIPSGLVAKSTVTITEMSLRGVTVSFPGGLELSENRKVDIGVEPFTVPEGGIEATFRTSAGDTYVSHALSGRPDGSLKAEYGKTLDIYIPSADPFIPCTFPVVFPLGPNPDARTGYYNYSDDQPDWSNQGIWRCFAQKQAWARWVKVSDPSPLYRQKREMVATGDIGSIGLKGIWTGDYFEFTIPVENVAAGAKVSFKAPFYGRQQPIFWTVEWLDGGIWTNRAENITSWDQSATVKASFATVPYGTVIDYGFTLANPIDRGDLKVRIICTDGHWQANNDTNTAVYRTLPFTSGGEYFSPFYFYCADSGCYSFSWNIE